MPQLTWVAELAAIACFLATAVTISAIDLRHYRIPDRILLPGASATLALLTVAALSEGQLVGAWQRSLATAAVCLAAFLLLHLGSPTQLGFGDVKLAGLIGLVTGWFGPGLAALAIGTAFLGAGLAVVVLITRRLARLDTHIAFGPWLVLGTLAAIAPYVAAMTMR